MVTGLWEIWSASKNTAHFSNDPRLHYYLDKSWSIFISVNCNSTTSHLHFVICSNQLLHSIVYTTSCKWLARHLLKHAHFQTFILLHVTTTNTSVNVNVLHSEQQTLQSGLAWLLMLLNLSLDAMHLPHLQQWVTLHHTYTFSFVVISSHILYTTSCKCLARHLLKHANFQTFILLHVTTFFFEIFHVHFSLPTLLCFL